MTFFSGCLLGRPALGTLSQDFSLTLLIQRVLSQMINVVHSASKVTTVSTHLGVMKHSRMVMKSCGVVSPSLGVILVRQLVEIVVQRVVATRSSVHNSNVFHLLLLADAVKKVVHVGTSSNVIELLRGCEVSLLRFDKRQILLWNNPITAPNRVLEGEHGAPLTASEMHSHKGQDSNKDQRNRKANPRGVYVSQQRSQLSRSHDDSSHSEAGS
mmetsp:Transcript_51216/g.159993  ORF Transcript_51216/g.159993 Transcript_51216/m.159993 type:complete len:213 (+) Transcript_51216:1146-1784(+)